ncbi:hypothetical protein [Uliginosibacterium gangwonense]|uniref:hypothetical protein n=1 Tax=Uliginosibacterium gangwonense TaxID=392736 RepID=UPI000370AB55|nr:hypothetical protein [Uliginosibacterium gangwonense]
MKPIISEPTRTHVVRVGDMDEIIIHSTEGADALYLSFGAHTVSMDACHSVTVASDLIRRAKDGITLQFDQGALLLDEEHTLALASVITAHAERLVRVTH